MFRVIFVSIDGGEREVFVAANSERDAVMNALVLRDFGFVLSCTQLDSLEDWAVQDHRRQQGRKAA